MLLDVLLASVVTFGVVLTLSLLGLLIYDSWRK